VKWGASGINLRPVVADRSIEMTGHSEDAHVERGLLPFGLCLAALLVVVLPLPPTSSSAESGSRFVSLPGPESGLPAPAGPIVLANTDFAGRDPAHRLALLNRAAARTLWVHDYRRHVVAGWSADGRFLAVTDYQGSDLSKVFIVRVSKRGAATTIDVSALLARSGLAKQEIGRAAHMYLEGVKWTGSDRLLLRLSGHGSRLPSGAGPAFARCYEYRVGRGFRAARATECVAPEED